MNLQFVCSECGKGFEIPLLNYRGQFDHPPNEPICEDCKEDWQ